MKRDKDWIDVIRSELRETGSTPPADGWERLRRELAETQAAAFGTGSDAGAAPRIAVSGTSNPGSAETSGAAVPAAAARGRVMRLRWPRIVAAAAAVLVCVVTGELLWRASAELEEDGFVIATADGSGEDDADVYPESLTGISGAAQTPALAQIAPVPEKDKGLQRLGTDGRMSPGMLSGAASEDMAPSVVVSGSDARFAAASEDAAVSADRFGTGSTGKIAQSAAAVREKTDSDVSAPVVAPNAESVDRAGGPVTEPQAASREKTRVSSRAATESSTETRSAAAFSDQADPVRNRAFPDERFVAYSPPRKKASFGLYAGGVVTGGGTEGPGIGRGPVMSDISTVIGNGDNMSLMQQYDFAGASFRHHQPLSFGLSVRKEFAYGLSLESGVNYTLLRSDVRLRYATGDVTQKLHFIGVPLRLNWQYLQKGGFSLYIGAGGMVEKCVSAKFGSKVVDEAAVQWSVLGAAGAEYRFGGLVGLYFEPEVSYYFTGTMLQTARTDSPLTLTLRLGVRFSF